jgi:hypothetical protein
MVAVIAKRKIEAISVDMKKTFSAESAEEWLKEKNKKKQRQEWKPKKKQISSPRQLI